MTIYHKRYFRIKSSFNPTLKNSGDAIAQSPFYDLKGAVSKGQIAPAAITSTKRKFTIYNSDIKVLYIRFFEVTFEDATENALFFTYFSPYKWVSPQNCAFELR